MLNVLNLPPSLDTSTTSAPLDCNPSFTCVAKASRVIREYSGCLPYARHITRHTLRCEHLRPLPGERFQPHRVEPHYTHQIWLWHRTQQQPDQLILVFRGQFEFAIPGWDTDEVAAEVADFLANFLLNAKDYQRIIYEEDPELFWTSLITTKIDSLKGTHQQNLF